MPSEAARGSSGGCSTPSGRSPSFSNTAKLLGLSSQQLQTDLQSGQTLSSLAQQQGVSSSSLLSGVEQDLKSNAPKGASSVSNSQLQQIATNIINGTPPAQSGGSVGVFGQSAQQGSEAHGPSLQNTAQLLGLSSQQLQTDLQSGQTLSSLAQQQGVSSSSLLSSVEQDLQSNAPQGASSVSNSQLQQIATNIINGTPPAQSGGSVGVFGQSAQQGSEAHGPSLQNTAQLLGLSSQQLQTDLQSGQTLDSLAQQQGVSSSSLLSSVEQDLQSNAPQGASSVSNSQLQQIATNIINGNLPSPAQSGSGLQNGGNLINQYA